MHIHRRGFVRDGWRACRHLLAIALLVPGLAAAQAQRAVLVTGAGSGIGRRVTERLAERGLFVYAGARSQKDLDALGAIRNVQAVRLDVTSASDVAAAVETIRRAGRGLHGVVNNAGIAIITPMIEADEKDLREIFDVNVFGTWRVTKAFAPLLIESKGRIVNISSLNGIVAQPIIGAYSMTKHAVEAYSDALGAEMIRLGVRVSIIEPGNYGTGIGRSTIARTDTSRLAESRFAAQIRNTLGSMSAFDRYPAPDEVADAVYDAMTSAEPKARYLVVPAGNQAEIVFRKLFAEVAQMNDDQRFSLSRDSLVRMLDEALARSRRPR